MGFLDRVFAGNLSAPDEGMKDAFLAAPTASGQNVNADTALRVAAVYACVRILSESVASLPLHVYRRNADGSTERAKEHPLDAILSAHPNSEQTAFELRETQMGHLALRGNHYAQVVRNKRGDVAELWPLPYAKTRMERDSANNLVFPVEGDRTFPADQIWRVAGLGTNGLQGLSPISLAREAVGLAMATEQHGATLFGNGAHPGGVLSTEGRFQDEGAIERLREQFKDHYTGNKAHKPLVLEQGLKWSQIGLSSEDSQFLETRKFQRTEIASIFRIPPHMIADLEKASFSNIEHQSLEFVMHTLRPWLVRIEQSIQRDLFLPRERGRYFAAFNVEGLLRGDTKSRYEAYGAAIKDGWMTRNEVRQLENRNRADGLDEFLFPLNMGPANEDSQ